MRIPTENDFVGQDFIEDPSLSELGDKLLGSKFSELNYDGLLVVEYRWKRKGGKSGGNLVMGRCNKLSGASRHFANGADFLIWLAADHHRAAKSDDHQLEAVMFHELCHIEREDPEDDEKGPIFRTKGHDAEVFFADLKEYGTWSANRVLLVETVRQLALPIEVPA